MHRFLCKSLLFDLDGVLVDFTLAVERVWRKWAAQHRLNAEKVVEHAHGRRSIETVRIVAPHLNAEQENLNVERMEIEDKEGVVPIPGAPELLRSLPPDRYAVVTSATRALASARLQYAGLDVPQNLITADDVTKGKPSPEPYLKGAALLGFASQDCVVFEDTPAGIESARTAGMPVIALSTTYPEKDLYKADAILKSLKEATISLQKGKLQLELT